VSGAIVELGRLERVALREAWPDEARNFTPWLADDTNLGLLGEALGIQLELETTERAVGPFSADILAKEVGTDRWVLVENQIEPTDHKHLGPLLTYAAGLEARTIIWVAESFREEHRAALDFLNSATTDEFGFFGVQIELFRIGQSDYAPSFTVIAKPNAWSRRAQAAKQVAEGSLSPTQEVSREFWQSMIDNAAFAYPQLSGKSPSKLSWQAAETIRSSKGFMVSSDSAFTMQSRLRVEAYLGGTLAKAAFQELQEFKAEIEAAFGNSLEWEELPSGQDSRIAFYMDGKQDRTQKSSWPEIQKWLLPHWRKLADAIRPFALRLSTEGLEARAEANLEG
jgi:Domain of unknown function (DUF4268)